MQNKIRKYIRHSFFLIFLANIYSSPLHATRNPWQPQVFFPNIESILREFRQAIQEHWDVRNYVITLDQAQEHACIQMAGRDIQEQFEALMHLLRDPNSRYLNEHKELVPYRPYDIAYIQSRFLFTPSEPIPPEEMVFPEYERFAFIVHNIQQAESLDELDALAHSLGDVHQHDWSFKRAYDERKQNLSLQYAQVVQPPTLDPHFRPFLAPSSAGTHEEFDPSATPDSPQIYRLSIQELSQYIFSCSKAERTFNSNAISIRLWQLEQLAQLSREDLELLRVMKETLEQNAAIT